VSTTTWLSTTPILFCPLFLPYRHPVVPGGRMYSGKKKIFFLGWGTKKKKYLIIFIFFLKKSKHFLFLILRVHNNLALYNAYLVLSSFPALPPPGSTGWTDVF
jgi:hypothetical protein